MDDDTKAFLVAMEARLFDRLTAVEGRLLARMNNQHERLIDMLTSLRSDFDNTKGFLIGDALVVGRRLRGVEDRLDDLEKKQG